MNIYKISQTKRQGYDIYDSAVVCAENEDEARKIHPSEYVTHYKNGLWYGTYSKEAGESAGKEYETENNYSSWVLFNEIEYVQVKLIGKANKEIKKGVIVASFNAG